MLYKTALDVDSSNLYSDTSPRLPLLPSLFNTTTLPSPPFPTFSECLCGLGKVLMDKVFKMLDHLEPEEAEVRECNHTADSMA